MRLSLLAIGLDATDAGRLADVWARLLDRPVDHGANADFASIGLSAAGSGTEVWMFHKVPEPKVARTARMSTWLPTTWTLPVGHAINLGATRLGDFDEGSYQWATLADPEGNEFDIVATP